MKFNLIKQNGSITINGIETKHEPTAEEIINNINKDKETKQNGF